MATRPDKKELKIIKAISNGETVVDIADKNLGLKVTERQLYREVETMKIKFGAKNLPHLVAIFLREKFID